MLIFKGGYRDHWVSPYTLIEYAFFWTDWSKCGRNRGVIADADYVDHPQWVEWVVPAVEPISKVIKAVLDFVHPPINIVKIHRYDTWSADHTLADIILPMLKQLKFTKHGAPFTDDSDVPEYLRSTEALPKENEWDTDSLHFMRWDWILDEMIWAFEQKVDDNADSKFFEFPGLDELGDSKMNNEYIDEFNRRIKNTKYDKEGYEAWQARKANGFRLFGKYYEALWD